MELKYNSENNVCEYFNENNGSIVHVLSGDRGLWFNLNDAFELFGAIKANKLWFSKNLNPQEKRWVEFYRKGRQSKEIFIPEQSMHRLISKIQGDFNDNVDFIYGIIADYDMTCINIKDVDLNVEQRIALKRLKAETDNYAERVRKYTDVLKSKTHLGEYYNLYEEEIEKEIKSHEMKYDNEKCPEDLRQEIKEQERIEREKARANKPRVKNEKDTINEVAEFMVDGMDAIYDYLDQFEDYNEDVEEYEVLDDQPLFNTYNDMKKDCEYVNDNIKYANECIQEKIDRVNAVLDALNHIEGKTEEKKKSTCPDWLRSVVK